MGKSLKEPQTFGHEKRVGKREPKSKFSLLSSKHMKILFIFLAIFVVSGIILGVTSLLSPKRPSALLATFVPVLTEPTTTPPPTPQTEPPTPEPVPERQPAPSESARSVPSPADWAQLVAAMGGLIGSVGSVVSALVAVTAVRKARR